MKLIFICHGNICRSTMAEALAKHLVDEAKKQGKKLKPEFASLEICSRATSSEELGNPPHHGTIRELQRRGISLAYLSAKKATKLCPADFSSDNLLYYMDQNNRRNIVRSFDIDALKNCFPLLSKDVADPWYTGDFQTCYDDVYSGVKQIVDDLFQ